jgi:non-lysosomal glucosylceramidase
MQDVNHALEVGLKAIEHWHSVIHDQWNVVGVIGGLGYGVDGLPYITSHYGYFMSSWHLVMALSGQKADMSEKSLTFTPKFDPQNDSPFLLPVVLPGVWGYLQSNQATDLKVSYSLMLHFGSLELTHLSVGDCAHPDNFISIKTYEFISWSCSYSNN